MFRRSRCVLLAKFMDNGRGLSLSACVCSCVPFFLPHLYLFTRFRSGLELESQSFFFQGAGVVRNLNVLFINKPKIGMYFSAPQNLSNACMLLSSVLYIARMLYVFFIAVPASHPIWLKLLLRLSNTIQHAQEYRHFEIHCHKPERPPPPPPPPPPPRDCRATY